MKETKAHKGKRGLMAAALLLGIFFGGGGYF